MRTAIRNLRQKSSSGVAGAVSRHSGHEMRVPASAGSSMRLFGSRNCERSNKRNHPSTSSALPSKTTSALSCRVGASMVRAANFCVRSSTCKTKCGMRVVAHTRIRVHVCCCGQCDVHFVLCMWCGRSALVHASRLGQPACRSLACPRVAQK
eukprot:6589784-Prymnesium_polylepis.1